MHNAVETFVEDLRRSRFASAAGQIEAALRFTDAEADGNPDAAALFEAITWIVGHTGRSLTERVIALNKLIEHDGSGIELHEFTGWLE